MMPFTYQRLANDDFEVVMQPNTIFSRPNVPRRFAYCTHENDAEVITEALNAAERRQELR